MTPRPVMIVINVAWGWMAILEEALWGLINLSIVPLEAFHCARMTAPGALSATLGFFSFLDNSRSVYFGVIHGPYMQVLVEPRAICVLSFESHHFTQ